MARQMIVLKSEAEYEQALDEIEKFFEAEPRPGTAEAEQFDELTRAIADYEARHWPIGESREQAGHAPSRPSGARRTN